MKDRKKTYLIIALSICIIILVLTVVSKTVKKHNLAEETRLISALDEEYEREGYRCRLGIGYAYLAVKNSTAYCVWLDGVLSNKKEYIDILNSSYAISDYMGYETNTYDMYYYSVENIDSFYVGVVIRDKTGKILYSGINEINDKSTIGNIKINKGQTVSIQEYFLIDDRQIKAYETATATKVPIFCKKNYVNEEWQCGIMFGLKPSVGSKQS